MGIGRRGGLAVNNLGFLGYEPSDMEHVRLILAAAADRGLTLADLAKSAEIADSLDAWDDTVSGWKHGE